MSRLPFWITLKRSLDALKQKRQINLFDITIFLRQLATLISAGIPIIQCCDILEKSQEKIALRLLIYALKREILSGKNLFHSLQHHPHHFDPFTCELIQIGEHTGKLDVMLTTVALHQEKNLTFKKRIKRALFYPCMITITALLITISMFLFIVPRFADLFHDSQDKLPALTLWIFYFSARLKEQIVTFLIGITVFTLFLFHSKHAIIIKKYFWKILLSLPLIKQCIHKIALTRFARNLAITLTAGIPILDALKLTANAWSNPEFINMTATLRHKISAGLQLHHAMETLSYFPLLMIQMVKIGEESGKLEHMLNKIADFIESDIDQLLSHCNQLLEPLIMIVLGALIGGLVIGMYLPIFKLGNVL